MAASADASRYLFFIWYLPGRRRAPGRSTTSRKCRVGFVKIVRNSYEVCQGGKMGSAIHAVLPVLVSLLVSHRAPSDWAPTADPEAPAWKGATGVWAERDRRGEVVP